MSGEQLGALFPGICGGPVIMAGSDAGEMLRFKQVDLSLLQGRDDVAGKVQNTQVVIGEASRADRRRLALENNVQTRGDSQKIFALPGARPPPVGIAGRI